MDQLVFVSMDAMAVYDANGLPRLAALADVSSDVADARRRGVSAVVFLPNAPLPRRGVSDGGGRRGTAAVVAEFFAALGVRVAVVSAPLEAVRNNPVGRAKFRGRIAALARKGAVPIVHQAEDVVPSEDTAATDVMAATLAAGSPRDVWVMMFHGLGLTDGKGNVLEWYVKGQSYHDPVQQKRADIGVAALMAGAALVVACGCEDAGGISHLLSGRQVGTLIILEHSVGELERRRILASADDMEDSQDLTDIAVTLLRSLKHTEEDERSERTTIEVKAENSWIEDVWAFRQKVTLLQRRQILSARKSQC